MIDQTAIIHKNAEVDESAYIGPYCVIEEKVRIGKGVRLTSHVIVQNGTQIGENCTISPFASIGGPPQDLTYKGEDTSLFIGNNNAIKEYVTISRGTVHGGGITSIGNNNFIMAYAHIGHDCKLGNNIIMANGATLAGHVEIADYASLSGLCAFHQFCKVGKYAFISGLTGVSKDVPPFVTAAGDRAKLYGLNVVGLERRGFTKEDITQLKKAYRIIFRSALPLSTSLKIVQDELSGDHVNELIEFIRSSKRGICR
ncbi:MAG: acyl-[acyl-carrier-protein]--UDP-N-acetylglucosamine O-acyltransferase [Syntrophus sp. (in: bacteria)]|nr:acyl-[acyl-carrier-protein]--UDP-N-acetylglucosamine O-acyltransferase [Syntrophus sp. (in: bacteria)]